MVSSDVMVGTQAPERARFAGVKSAIKLRRFIKELSHEEDISLKGAKGRKLDSILDTADQALSDLQLENADWVSKKRQLFADYLSPVEPGLAEEVYRSGLATTITQEFRTYSKVSHKELLKLDDAKYLKGVIIGYTVDFLRSLSLSQRMDIYPNIALDIARLSYHYNPTRLIEVIRKYPDINPGVINSAAISYPKNPEAFLDGFILNVDRLSKDPRYADINPGVINSAAIGYPKNPEAFLDKVIAGKVPADGIREGKNMEVVIPIDL